jgi:hypothetical protein
MRAAVAQVLLPSAGGYNEFQCLDPSSAVLDQKEK